LRRRRRVVEVDEEIKHNTASAQTIKKNTIEVITPRKKKKERGTNLLILKFVDSEIC
jgi:hypothetical protein